jgi:hypothetical protein
MREHYRQLDVSVETSVARFPKFVCHSRPHFHELRKAKGNRIFLIPVPLTILKFLKGIAANSGGTSKSAVLVHTTSPSALATSSALPKRPSHPAPNVRDDRETPL